MPNPAHLWALIHVAFEAHRQHTDPDAHTAFERIAQKCLFLPKRQHFNSNNCAIRLDSSSADDISELRVFHNRADPKGDKAPIVIIEVGLDRVVIDGNNRVNLWKSQGTRGPFEAIVVTPVSNDT